jgi:hypothetical protein
VVRVPAPRRTEHADSVEPGSRPGSRTVYVVEHATSPLDHDRRRGVVVVARDEHAVDPLSARNDERLAEDFGGVAATPVAWADPVSDVAGKVPEERVQLVADRDATDDLRADLGHEEGAWNSVGPQLQSSALLPQALKVGPPWLVSPPVQEELELLAREFVVGGYRVALVAKAQRPQPQIGGGGAHQRARRWLLLVRHQIARINNPMVRL